MQMQNCSEIKHETKQILVLLKNLNQLLVSK